MSVVIRILGGCVAVLDAGLFDCVQPVAPTALSRSTTKPVVPRVPEILISVFPVVLSLDYFRMLTVTYLM